MSVPDRLVKMGSGGALKHGKAHIMEVLSTFNSISTTLGGKV